VAPEFFWPCRAGFYFFTLVSHAEHLSWLVVYGRSVYLPHDGHLFPLAISAVQAAVSLSRSMVVISQSSAAGCHPGLPGRHRETSAV